MSNENNIINYEDHMREEIHTQVREKFIKTLGDAFNYIENEDIIDYAVENVFETSAIKDEGYYNDADINLAVQRSITHFIIQGQLT